MSVFFHLCFIPEKAETHEKDVSGVKRVRVVVVVVCCFFGIWNEKHFVGHKFSIFSSFYVYDLNASLMLLLFFSLYLAKIIRE